MKVALVGCSSVRYMPYISLYTNICENNGIEYCIINEHEKNEQLLPNQFVYRIGTQNALVKKVKKFFGWRSFVRQTLKEQKVDCVVLLTVWPGIKFMDFWTRKYKDRYILDIRDYTDEDKKWFYRSESKLIKNSYMTVISSEKFKSWLVSSDKIHVVHNIPPVFEPNERPTLKPGESFTIGYVGLVNYEKENRAIVDAFSDCMYVTLKYKGDISRSCHIKEYCQDAKNVVFTGRFENSNKKALYEDVDIINAVYGNENLIVTTALPNKLYDAIIYKKPIIASKGTFLGELVEQYGIGLTIDTKNDQIKEKILHYTTSFDEETFLAGCETLLQKVLAEHSHTKEKITQLFV